MTTEERTISTAPSTTLLEALAVVEASDQWAVDSTHVKDDGLAFAAAIRRGDAKAVSDGSFKNAKGTSASVLFSSRSTDTNRIVSVNSVPGNWNEQSAY